ncbi:ROK family protein [Actinoplanes sp. NEAU-A12]|uniref:ROK family protein n=1 Tax=Actinoplanes sandaracinus TaxID=3045177 RepID=A0ABT6WVQ6_9ACTN|nr:ROK family protein [Actinoplanes sandaracinus]MDI6103832.1 ROK family protein [Actinoplanes sandaracinus]
MTTRSTALLRVVHRHSGVTRADAARLLGIGTGAATELVTKLSRAALLAQAPAAPSGTRGRPTTVLLPHPDGPLVLACAITHEAWRLDVVALGGATAASLSARHGGARWADVRTAVAAAIEDLLSRYGDRLRAIGISVPGPVSRTLRLEAFTSDWHGIDLNELWPGAGLLVAGNDATLAATAEHLRGSAAGAAVALHLRIEAGLGGAVIDDGRPVLGAHGAAGEFGHMPFGDPAVRCGCGAHGCWGTAVDGTALARLLGAPEPRDPVTYARRVIATAARELGSQRARQDVAGLPPLSSGTPSGGAAAYPCGSGEAEPEIDPAASVEAVRVVGGALGRGLAGLVNALDPNLVTLGGIGVDLLAAVPNTITAAYRDGLMLIHRESPPPVLPAALPDDEGPIAGAAEEAWSALLPRLT